jgi:hypothetical protein
MTRILRRIFFIGSSDPFTDCDFTMVGRATFSLSVSVLEIQNLALKVAPRALLIVVTNLTGTRFCEAQP